MHCNLYLYKEHKEEESEVAVGKIREAIYEIHHMDETASKDRWMQNLHPLAKLLTAFVYIFVVVSFDKYDLPGLAVMGLYLFVLFFLESFRFFGRYGR